MNDQNFVYVMLDLAARLSRYSIAILDDGVGHANEYFVIKQCLGACGSGAVENVTGGFAGVLDVFLRLAGKF